MEVTRNEERTLEKCELDIVNAFLHSHKSQLLSRPFLFRLKFHFVEWDI